VTQAGKSISGLVFLRLMRLML